MLILRPFACPRGKSDNIYNFPTLIYHLAVIFAVTIIADQRKTLSLLKQKGALDLYVSIANKECKMLAIRESDKSPENKKTF